jgi:hypothetical protein
MEKPRILFFIISFLIILMLLFFTFKNPIGDTFFRKKSLNSDDLDNHEIQTKNQNNNNNTESTLLNNTSKNNFYENFTLSTWVSPTISEYREANTELFEIGNNRLSEYESTLENVEMEKKALVLEKISKINDALKILEFLQNTDDYIDKDKNGLISYEEYNLKSPEISNAVYNVRHKIYLGKEEKIFNQEIIHDLSEINHINSVTGNSFKVLKRGISSENNDNLVKNSKDSDLIFVFVEAGIFEDILISLREYEDILESCEKVNVIFISCNDCNHGWIRNTLIRTYNNFGDAFIGAVFVGDLPYVWFSVPKYDSNGLYFEENFPTDLYFSDLDGYMYSNEPHNNKEEGSCKNPFRRHSDFQGDKYPEIYIGRIVSPIEIGEKNLINSYFLKNKKFKARNYYSLNYDPGIILFVDDDWKTIPHSFLHILYNFYNPKIRNNPDLTSVLNYIESWAQYSGYRHLYLASHSSHLFHSFREKKYDPISGFTGKYFYNKLNWRKIKYGDRKYGKPSFGFVNLYSCSAARYTENNFIAGWYIFNDEPYGGLIVAGSTKRAGMRYVEIYYNNLLKNNLGNSLKKWFIEKPDFDKNWDYGMVLIGDPTLYSVIPYSDDNEDEYADCVQEVVSDYI